VTGAPSDRATPARSTTQAARARLAALNERVSLLAYELIAAVISFRETAHALRTSRAFMQHYRSVSAAQPGLARRDLYRRIVMAHSGTSEQDADAMLVRAEQSFATWPRPRALTFVDVVRYAAVSEYLARRPGFGTRVNMGLLVAGRISPDL
jgi:hypothetical protein